MTTKLKNGWNKGEATEDGVYLRAFDEWDDDEDGDEFQLIEGKWHKDDAPWFCYGGVWKRIGDLLNRRNVWMKCEVCEWQEEFSVMDVNCEKCSIQFCEDCDQSRVFTLV